MCVKETTQQKEDFNTALSLLKDIPIDSEDPFEDIFSFDKDDPTFFYYPLGLHARAAVIGVDKKKIDMSLSYLYQLSPSDSYVLALKIIEECDGEARLIAEKKCKEIIGSTKSQKNIVDLELRLIEAENYSNELIDQKVNAITVNEETFEPLISYYQRKGRTNKVRELCDFWISKLEDTVRRIPEEMLEIQTFEEAEKFTDEQVGLFTSIGWMLNPVVGPLFYLNELNRLEPYLKFDEETLDLQIKMSIDLCLSGKKDRAVQKLADLTSKLIDEERLDVYASEILDAYWHCGLIYEAFLWVKSLHLINGKDHLALNMLIRMMYWFDFKDHNKLMIQLVSYAKELQLSLDQDDGLDLKRTTLELACKLRDRSLFDVTIRGCEDRDFLANAYLDASTTNFIDDNRAVKCHV